MESCRVQFKRKNARMSFVKPVFHLVTLFARREAKTRIRHCDWLKLAGEKIRREQVGTVPTFLSVRFTQTKSPSGKRALVHALFVMDFSVQLTFLCVL